MSTLDVVAYAGEEFGGVRPANFLDIGGGASAEVMANGLDIVLSDPERAQRAGERVRRHHLLRRGRQRHRVRHRRCWPSAASRSGTRSWSGWTATTRPRAAAILDEAGIAVVEQVGTMDDAARRAAELAAAAANGA